MRPVVQSITGSAVNGDQIMIDRSISPTSIGLAVVVSGTITYSVQHTFDNANDSSITVKWFDHPSFIDQTADKDANLAFPPRFVRLITTMGTGTATLTLIQAGG